MVHSVHHKIPILVQPIPAAKDRHLQQRSIDGFLKEFGRLVTCEQLIQPFPPRLSFIIRFDLIDLLIPMF